MALCIRFRCHPSSFQFWLTNILRTVRYFSNLKGIRNTRHGDPRALAHRVEGTFRRMWRIYRENETALEYLLYAKPVPESFEYSGLPSIKRWTVSVKWWLVSVKINTCSAGYFAVSYRFLLPNLKKSFSSVLVLELKILPCILAWLIATLFRAPLMP